MHSNLAKYNLTEMKSIARSLLLIVLLLWGAANAVLLGQGVERYAAYPQNLIIEHQLTAKLDERTNIKGIRNHQGMMYITTKDRGVFRTQYHQREVLEAIKYDILRDKEVSHTIDLWGQLWLIVDNQLLYCLSGLERNKRFGGSFNRGYVLMDVAVHKDKFVHAMLGVGLKFQPILEPNRIASIYQPFLKNESLASDDVRTLFVDQDSILWIGTDKGLSSFDGDTMINHTPVIKQSRVNGILRKIGLKKESTDSQKIIFPHAVTAIIEYNGALIVGGPDGIWRIQKDGDQLLEFEALSLPYRLNLVNDLLVDHNRMLWIAGDQLLKYDFLTNRCVNFNELPDGNYRSKRAFCLEEDQANQKVWVGTSGSGVYIIDNQKGPNEKFREVVSNNLRSVQNQVNIETTKMTRSSEAMESSTETFRATSIDVYGQYGEVRTYHKDSLMQMEGVRFAVNSDQLTPGARNYLKALSQDLQQIVAAYQDVCISIHGHTSQDQQGRRERNQLLSELRAEQVRDFLLHQGVQPQRFRVQGFGDQQPLRSHIDDLKNRVHRRVEIEISFSKPIRHFSESR
ncbi:MAG: OmpA family protein [Bacteroidota bacterium]